MPDLLSLSGLLLIVAALVVGISKTSVSGFGSFAVAAFALVMPAKESTAAVLLLLIIGDIVAVLRYRKHCNWALLRRLLPSVLPGVALGAWVLSVISDVGRKQRALRNRQSPTAELEKITEDLRRRAKDKHHKSPNAK